MSSISTKSLFFPGRCGHQNHFVPTKASHTALQAYGVRILHSSGPQESHLFKKFSNAFDSHSWLKKWLASVTTRDNTCHKDLQRDILMLLNELTLEAM